MVIAAIAGAAARGAAGSAAKGAARKAVTSEGRDAARRQASREADKLRKRYRREKATLQAKLEAGTTEKQSERFSKRIESLDEKIESLKFNRETGGYGMDREEMKSAELQSRQSTKKTAAGLRLSGMSEQFYADTKDLWAHDKTPGKTTNQKIIDSINSLDFKEETKELIKHQTGIDLDEKKITELSEAVDVIKALTGTDYLSGDGNEQKERLEPWDRYKEEEAIRAALAIRQAATAPRKTRRTR